MKYYVDPPREPAYYAAKLAQLKAQMKSGRCHTDSKMSVESCPVCSRAYGVTMEELAKLAKPA